MDLGAPRGAARPARTFRAVLEYDGTDFHGWQVQGERRTVQGEVERALAGVTGERVPVVAAGRTDAGVHAEGQVISFRSRTTIPSRGLAQALNARLPEDVAVLLVEEAPAGFHATRDALSKVYRYVLVPSAVPRPLRRRTAWRVRGRLDPGRMREGARHVLGRHDFRSFRTNPGVPGDRGTTVRTVHRLDIRRKGDALVVEVEGDGFLYNMVRALVGTLVQVGRGAWEPEQVREALEARDRRASGPTAPPQGLTLASVLYEGPWPGKRKIGSGGRRRPRMERGDGRRRVAAPREQGA